MAKAICGRSFLMAVFEADTIVTRFIGDDKELAAAYRRATAERDRYVRESEQAARRLAAEQQKIQKAFSPSSIIGDAGGIVPGVGRFGGGALAAGGAAVAGLYAAAKAGVSYRESIERLTKSFEALTGSQAAALQHLSELQRFAARTPFEFLDVAQASQRFQNMGVAAKDVIPYLTAIGNAVAKVGGGKEQIDSVSLAIAQIGARGKFSAQEANQLANALVDAWGPLEKELGKTRAELMKMSEAGEISADTFLRAFRNAHEGGNAMQKQMQTLTGAMSTLRDEGNRLLGETFQPLHAALTATAIELAKNTTEGFNLSRAFEAVHKASYEAMRFINPALREMSREAYDLNAQFGTLGPAVMLWGYWSGLKRKGPAPPPADQQDIVPGGGLPKDEREKMLASIQRGDATANAAAFAATRAGIEAHERALKEAEAERKKAQEEARRETERQSDVLRRITSDYDEASMRVTHFTADTLQLEAGLYKLAIGYDTLSEANKRLADEVVNRLFSSKQAQGRLEENKRVQDEATKQLRAWAGELGYAQTPLQRLTELLRENDDAVANLRQSFGTDLPAGVKAGLDPAVERALRLQAVLVQIKTTLDKFGDIGPPNLEGYFKPITLPEGGPTVPYDGQAPRNVWADRAAHQKLMRELADDVVDIYGSALYSIQEGWRGMWAEMANIARQTLIAISQEIMRTLLTGQKSGAGGLIGLGANFLSSLLGSFGGGLPTGSLGAGSLTSVAMGSLSVSPNPRGFASGTFSAPPGLAWVGERGPELVRFRGGERVHSAPESRAMSGRQEVHHLHTVRFADPPPMPASSARTRVSEREAQERVLRLILG